MKTGAQGKHFIDCLSSREERLFWQTKKNMLHSAEVETRESELPSDFRDERIALLFPYVTGKLLVS